VLVLGSVRQDGIKNSVLKLKKGACTLPALPLCEATFYMSVGVCVLGLK
jgi:hypothetical protein